MRKAWEANTGALKPSELPAESFLEWRSAQVDDGKFAAESLAEVASQQEESAQTDDTTQADFVREGSRAVLRAKRTKTKKHDAEHDRATAPQVPAPRGTLGHDVPAVPEQAMGSWVRTIDAQVAR